MKKKDSMMMDPFEKLRKLVTKDFFFCLPLASSCATMLDCASPVCLRAWRYSWSSTSFDGMVVMSVRWSREEVVGESDMRVSVDRGVKTS